MHSNWIQVDALRIHYLQAGSEGAPLLLLHGGGIDSAMLSWQECIGPLSAQHRVIAPDLPGYGESDKPDVAYTLDYYVDFVRRLLDAFDLPKVSLAGLSLGGGCALSFALRYPSRVDRLVLVDAYGIFSHNVQHKLGYLYSKTPLNELSYRLFGMSRDLVRWSLLAGLIYDAKRLSPDLVEEVYQQARRPDAGKAFISFQRHEILWQGLHSDFTQRLHELTVPTLIIHGAQDSAVPVAWARRAHERIQGSQLAVLEGCRHWPQREKPEEFTRLVLDFLEANG